jgi:membrane protein DedA with SNARE-associated domain
MHNIHTFIQDYGIWAVLVGAMLEGETVVIIAGFLAHQHVLHAPSVAVSAFVGSVLLDQLLFFVGRRYRDTRFVKRMRRAKVFERALEFLAKYPTSFILGFRFMYGFRTVGPVALGICRTPTSRYVVLNIVSAAVWAIAFTAIGYVFGQAIESGFGRLHGIKPKLIAALIVGVAFVIVHHIVGKRRHPDDKKPAENPALHDAMAIPDIGVNATKPDSRTP